MSVNIKQRRSELNLTLEQIGNYVGVSKSTVKKWENGYIKNMRRDKIILLSQILNVSPLDFLNINNSDTVEKNLSDLSITLANSSIKKIEHAIGTLLSDAILIYKDGNNYILKKMTEKQLNDILHHLT